MKNALASILLAGSLSGGVALAQTQNVTSGLTEKGVGLAAHGFDVVSFFEGKPAPGLGAYTAVHDGAAYRFASQEHLRAFQQNPAKYAPQYGGFCAFGAANGKKFDGNPHFWKVVDGRLYFNLSEEIQSKWETDVPGNIVKGDTNWKRIAGKAPKDL
jgi:YHS domain-containing protein